MKNTLSLNVGSIAALAFAGMAGLSATGQAAVIHRGIEGKPYHEVRPAPKSIYPDQKVVTAQPSPSDVNPAYLGPVLLMKSGIVNLKAGTVTLPLFKGRLASGQLVWSILTDTTDKNLAKLHGINYSAKLAYAAGGTAVRMSGCTTLTCAQSPQTEEITGTAVRHGHIDKDGTIVFDAGKVDFSPKRSVTPGKAPNFFPPKAFHPGSVGDADYSPLVVLDGSKSVVYNMPMVAFDVSAGTLDKMCHGHADHSIVEDKVVKICPRDGTVTLKMTLGYTFGKPIFYISTEANDKLVASLEGATYTPTLSALPFALQDASPGEAAERLYTFVNGPTGINNPFRQGLDSALSDKGNHGPLNVLGGIPTINLDYSPMWRLFPVKWTRQAIKKGYRTKMTGAIAIEDAGARGIIKSVEGGPPKPVGIIVNCPVVYRVN